MKAEVLTIGDELLRGEIIDSNKALLSQRLLDLDIETRFQTSVRDDPPDMRDAFRRAASRCDCVLVSGGLGPTRDDLTTQVLAESFGLELELDEEALDGVFLLSEVLDVSEVPDRVMNRPGARPRVGERADVITEAAPRPPRRPDEVPRSGPQR